MSEGRHKMSVYKKLTPPKLRIRESRHQRGSDHHFPSTNVQLKRRDCTQANRRGILSQTLGQREKSPPVSFPVSVREEGRQKLACCKQQYGPTIHKKQTTLFRVPMKMKYTLLTLEKK